MASRVIIAGRDHAEQDHVEAQLPLRCVPRMNGLDIVKKLRATLDKNGYTDVETKLIGDVLVARGGATPTSRTLARTRQLMASIGLGGGSFGGFILPQPPVVPQGPKTSTGASNALFTNPVPALTGGYWPSYLFTRARWARRLAPSCCRWSRARWRLRAAGGTCRK